ncbi:hypothetical protein ACH47Z_28195 [Streptomyces sp. NPDC020192]|uniref:hypothetical protein n=1 Tax=Streptomyces sp. NPDC020192 TaxID=3365066 RepID=UPI0037A5F8A8
MLGWLKSKSTRQERELAWATQVALAARAPFALTGAQSPREDPDSLVGEAVYDSDAVHTTLMRLAKGISPNLPVTATTVTALSAVADLLALRPSWAAYCNGSFALAPDDHDPRSEMCRQWVSGEIVRAWPRFSEAERAHRRAAESIARLQAELARLSGHAITSLTHPAA